MLADFIFEGPPVDDPELFSSLPGELQQLLRQQNGFIAFRGGLHVRGACRGPYWHSLRHAISSPTSFAALYPAVEPSDIPFAEDCVGDQFLLRDGMVFRLEAETGDVDPMDLTLDSFMSAAEADPTEFLSLYPLLQLEAEGGQLEPGQLVHAYPPFCTQESGAGVSLRAIEASQVIAFHARLAQAIGDLPDGGRLVIRLEE